MADTRNAIAKMQMETMVNMARLNRTTGLLAVMVLGVALLSACGSASRRGRLLSAKAALRGPNGQCGEGEIWMKIFKRCWVVSCHQGKFHDRGECVDECPERTIGWLPTRSISRARKVSRAGFGAKATRTGAWKCSTVLELRDLIRIYDHLIEKLETVKTTDAARRTLTRAYEGHIEVAKAALTKLENQGGRLADPSAHNGRPGECATGSTWNKIYQRCSIVKCRRGKFLDRKECVDECPAQTIAWERSFERGQQCSTMLELRDAITYNNGDGRKHSNREWFSSAATRRAEVALAKLKKEMQASTKRDGNRDGRDSRTGDDPRPSSGPPPPRDGPPPPRTSGPPPPRPSGPPPPRPSGPPPPRDN